MTVQSVQRHVIAEQDRDRARELMRMVEAVGSRDKVFVVVVPETGERLQTEVPRSVLPGIGGLVEMMASTGEATVMADEEEISTEDAATLLGMTRPMVEHRIRVGDIPHRVVGAQQRLRLSDVLVFREAEGHRAHAMAQIGEHTDAMTLRFRR